MKQEIEDRIRSLWSQALDEETERRYGMQKHHPAEDCPWWFINEFEQLALEIAREAIVKNVKE